MIVEVGKRITECLQNMEYLGRKQTAKNYFNYLKQIKFI